MIRRRLHTVLAALALCCTAAFSQTRQSQVSIRVVDEANAPVPNAQVSISALSNGSTLSGTFPMVSPVSNSPKPIPT